MDWWVHCNHPFTIAFLLLPTLWLKQMLLVQTFPCCGCSAGRSHSNKKNTWQKDTKYSRIKQYLAQYTENSEDSGGSVKKLQLSLFLISCCQGILNASWLSWYLVLKIACLHVSFTAYENFYKLSKMYCLLVLTFHFPIIRISEYRNPTIKHISTYTLISSSRSTYVTDLFLVIHFT